KRGELGLSSDGGARCGFCGDDGARGNGRDPLAGSVSPGGRPVRCKPKPRPRRIASVDPRASGGDRPDRPGARGGLVATRGDAWARALARLLRRGRRGPDEVRRATSGTAGGVVAGDPFAAPSEGRLAVLLSEWAPAAYRVPHRADWRSRAVS